jgi:HK97 family phage major capsid protein
MNDATTLKVRQLKDANGQYLWQPSVQAGQPATLVGYPVVPDDNMPDIAAGKFPIAFGDFNRGYLVADRLGVRVLRDPFTSKPYVLFYTTRRVGGGITDFAAIKLLKIATS